MMYTLEQYHAMIADSLRLKSYALAIAEAVRPGDVVAEIGAGLGVFSLLACRAGARKVYAIESEPIIDLARQLAAANGFGERIEFLRGDVRRVELPEKADVLISDLRGALPVHGKALDTLLDARTRFLSKGGRLIPQRDKLFAAIVSCETQHAALARAAGTVDDLDLRTLRPLLLNADYGVSLRREEVVSSAGEWWVLDYTSEFATKYEGRMKLRCTKTTVAHGIACWFETKLFGEIGFSSAPAEQRTVYGQVFFPWLEPVALSEGEEIEVALCANPVSDRYVWRWEAAIPPSGSRAAIHFRQSNFEGAFLSNAALAKRSVEFRPELSDAGAADSWMLQAMNGSSTLSELAELAVQRFPHVFPRVEAALRRAGELSQLYAR